MQFYAVLDTNVIVSALLSSKVESARAVCRNSAGVLGYFKQKRQHGIRN